jgi:hypothetical protein
MERDDLKLFQDMEYFESLEADRLKEEIKKRKVDKVDKVDKVVTPPKEEQPEKTVQIGAEELRILRLAFYKKEGEKKA